MFRYSLYVLHETCNKDKIKTVKYESNVDRENEHTMKPIHPILFYDAEYKT